MNSNSQISAKQESAQSFMWAPDCAPGIAHELAAAAAPVAPPTNKASTSAWLRLSEGLSAAAFAHGRQVQLGSYAGSTTSYTFPSASAGSRTSRAAVFMSHFMMSPPFCNNVIGSDLA